MADRQPIVCQGLGSLLADIVTVRWAGSATDLKRLGQQLAAVRGRTIVILGVWLSDSSAEDVLHMLRKDHPEVMVILVAEAREVAYIRRALRLQTMSVCVLDRVLTSLPQTVRKILNGENTVPTDILRKIASEPSQVLSLREYEILDLLRDGLTNKQISNETGLSQNTIKYYLKAIFHKLNVTSRGAAVAKYVAGQY